MPFTPFHFGFAVFLLSLIPFLDFITLTLGVVIIDLEGIICLISDSCPLHGKGHSFLGVFIFFIPLTLLSWISYRKFKLEKFLLVPRFNCLISLLSGIIGLLSHIFFDAIIYSEMMIFYPFSKDQGFLFGLWSSTTDYIILSVMFFVGIGLLILRYFFLKRKMKKEE